MTHYFKFYTRDNGSMCIYVNSKSDATRKEVALKFI